MIDAHHEYIREDNQIESESVLNAKGITLECYREFLGKKLTPGEGEADWGEILVEVGIDPDGIYKRTAGLLSSEMPKLLIIGIVKPYCHSIATWS